MKPVRRCLQTISWVVLAAGAATISHDLRAKVHVIVWGRVVDASTGMPIVGAEVTELGDVIKADGLPSCVHVAVSDSKGSYVLTACDRATVTYNAVGYDTRRLRYPDDFRCDGDDQCCGKLQDVMLKRSKG